MRLLLALAIVLLLLAALPGLAFADDGHIQGLPNFEMQSPTDSIHQFILGPVCLSLPGGPLDLDCNPAFLAREEKRQLRVNVVGNDQLSEVNGYRERINAGDSVGIVNHVLENRDPVIAQASTDVWYQHDWWALGYSPFRGGFATIVHNPAYPEIGAHIYKESEVFGKVGLLNEADDHLAVGLQMRYVERQFFRQQFDLLDALADPSEMQIEKQNVLYLEPGASYAFDSAWESAISATLTQTPIVQSGASAPFSPVVDIGFSTSPPFLDHHLRTSTHYTGLPDRPDVFSRFIWGAMYDFDRWGALSVSLGKSLIGVGLDGHIDSVVLGVGWKTEEIDTDEWNTTRVSTYLFQVGLVF